MEWYQRIKELRVDNDYTQKYIANLLETTQTNYSDYERNKHLLPLPHIITLAKFYGVTTDYILGLTSDPHHTTIKQITVNQRDHNRNTFNL